MAFSLRKIISNITYFKKPGDDEGTLNDSDDPNRRNTSQILNDEVEIINLEQTEPDSTSKQCNSKKEHKNTEKNCSAKKGSFSDTDLNVRTVKKEKCKSKKLKLDIKKANQSCESFMSDNDPENTPKHIFLESKSAEAFTERMRRFDFSKSFDIDSDDQSTPCEEEDIDIESLSDTDDDISLQSTEGQVKMCRKVETADLPDDLQLVPSATPESFGDVEIDKNEEERIELLQSYQIKLEKMESFLKKLFSEFEFHIEVSKIFNSRSIITTLPDTEVTNVPKIMGKVTYLDNINRGPSPMGSWNIILEKEDTDTKHRLANQLISVKNLIDQFVNKSLKNKNKKKLYRVTYEVRDKPKRTSFNSKKKLKHFDYPDFRDAMISLFSTDNDDITNVSLSTEESEHKCNCHCHDMSQTDSGLTTKSERSMSITSSIGNFSLDTSTLTAYSESLDQIISYESYQDTSLYGSLLQKPSIERITFYVQVHSIQLKCELEEFESKSRITFHCPACQTIEYQENGLLQHILSQSHCEKIHFLYKTAYIKKCVQAGKEIQPSTVLNPMKMYRDENKIVCFGDAMYACTLCFENLIIGESVLMGHCMEPDHVERRERLNEVID